MPGVTLDGETSADPLQNQRHRFASLEVKSYVDRDSKG